MQQFRASMFHMVVHWHKLGEVENECTLHNFVVLVTNMLKIIKLVKIWQSYDKNNFDCFFSETRCTCVYVRWEVDIHSIIALDCFQK